MNLTLTMHQGDLSIVRLLPDAGFPDWLKLAARPFVSITYSELVTKSASDAVEIIVGRVCLGLGIGFGLHA